jgi:hypothetical protein
MESLILQLSVERWNVINRVTVNAIVSATLAVIASCPEPFQLKLTAVTRAIICGMFHSSRIDKHLPSKDEARGSEGRGMSFFSKLPRVMYISQYVVGYFFCISEARWYACLRVNCISEWRANAGWNGWRWSYLI